MTVVNVLARKIRNLNFGGNANTTWPRSTQTSQVAVAVAVVGSQGPYFLQNFSTRNSPSVFPYLVKLNDNGSYHGLREPMRKLENHYPELKIY